MPDGEGVGDAATRPELAGRGLDERRGWAVRADGPLSLDPEPEAVPQARAWVRSVLEGWPEDLVDAARLLVSEVVTNAVLHARTPVTVSVKAAAAGAVFEVEDGHAAGPLPKHFGADSPTGRGLLLVESLAKEWGVTPTSAGKIVWFMVAATGDPEDAGAGAADAAGTDAGDRSEPPGSAARGWPALGELDPAMSGAAGTVPEGMVRVSILRLPLSVYFEAEEHNDAVMRELALIVQSSDGAGAAQHEVSRRLLELANEVSTAFGTATTGLRLQVEHASRRGDSAVDLHVMVPLHGWEKLLALAELLDEVDRYCENGELLTVSSPPTLRRFRHWYAQQVADQVAGLPPQSWPNEV